ncbi:cingulin-like [Lytechinus variegatus]|uniref:cingulin-like n=1 Tax=Lytechinus variegatus TaxID=7654 RepID=UPI001BB10817|nr:cingulin-like [Lytechinus variegatus]
MASSEIEKETEISYLRQEILTYTPGNASPGEDERVACLYPKKLIIYMIDVITGGVSDTVLANLRSALLVDGNVGESLKEPFNEEDREIRLTDFISVIIHHHVSGEAVDQLRVKALSEVVGCFLVVIGESGVALSQFLMSDWISPISDITGRPPIILMICDLGKQHADWTRGQLRDIGIIDIYEMPYPGNLSLEEDLELLRMLQRCLVESDEGVKIRFAKTMEDMCRDPAFRKIYEQALEGSKRAKQLEKLIEEERERIEDMEDLKERHGEEIRTREGHWQKKLDDKDEDVRALSDIVQMTWGRNETGLEAVRQQVEHLKEEREADRSRHQEDKLAMETEWKVEREALEKRIHALTDAVKMAEQMEEKLRQEIVEVENNSDELRIKHDDEKRALEAKLNYEEESNEEAIKQAIKDKEFTEEAMRQKLNALLTEREEEKAAHLKEKRLLKRRVKKEGTRIEQLERETQKLRNKIQIESEMRSMEQQRASERSGFSSFAIRLISGSQMDLTKGIHIVDDKQGNVHLTADSTLSLGSKSPPARDEFTDILKQIADDLFDEAQIDSLGGQLGIIQGDIVRAIKTNMRFHKITSDGTYEMLKEWRKGVSGEDERIELRRALLAAKLVDLADRYLPQEVEEALETPDLTNKTEEKDTNIECEEDGEVPKEGISKDEKRANQSYDQNQIEELETVESNQNEDADSDVSDDVAKQEELERRALMFIQEDGNTNGLEMGKAGVNFNIGDIEGTDNPPSDAAIVTENELQLVVDKSGDGANDVIIQDIELKHGSRRETGQIGEQLEVGVKSKPFFRWSLNQTVQEAREVNESNILDDSSDQVKLSCYCCYI